MLDSLCEGLLEFFGWLFIDWWRKPPDEDPD